MIILNNSISKSLVLEANTPVHYVIEDDFLFFVIKISVHTCLPPLKNYVERSLWCDVCVLCKIHEVGTLPVSFVIKNHLE